MTWWLIEIKSVYLRANIWSILLDTAKNSYDKI